MIQTTWTAPKLRHILDHLQNHMKKVLNPQIRLLYPTWSTATIWAVGLANTDLSTVV
jgi:hypothetical protein